MREGAPPPAVVLAAELRAHEPWGARVCMCVCVCVCVCSPKGDGKERARPSHLKVAEHDANLCADERRRRRREEQETEERVDAPVPR